jgi:hypothetical protein
LFGPWIFGLRGLPDGWSLKTVEVNGVDVTDTGREFTGGEQPLTARIVVTDQATEVGGYVTGGAGPAEGAHVVIFPEDRTKWTYPSRYIQSAQVDVQGRYVVRGLPPDVPYLAVAVDYADEGETGDPEFLDVVKERATRLSLEAGERKALDLRVTVR